MKPAVLGAVILGTGLAFTGASLAQDRFDLTNAVFLFNGQERSFTQSNVIDGARVAAFFARPDTCDGICISPAQIAEGVQTVTEAEVMAFVTERVVSGEGLLVDARMPDGRAAGYLTTSVNVPYALLGDDNPYRGEILVALGAREFEGVFNFADAMPLMVFDAGPASMEAAQMIEALLALGYPADRISYYRGGMQVWTGLGLSFEES